MAQSSPNALMAAVEQGVFFENGVYRYVDPGIPLALLRDIPVVRQQKLICTDDLYDECKWAQRQDVAKMRTLRLPVAGSFYKGFDKSLLRAGEHFASARFIVRFLVVNELSTGKRLLLRHHILCCDGDRYSVYVGSTTDGVHIDNDSDGYFAPSYELAAVS